MIKSENAKTVMIIVFYFIFLRHGQCSDVNKQKHVLSGQSEINYDEKSEVALNLSQNLNTCSSESKDRYCHSPSSCEARTSPAEAKSSNAEAPLNLTTNLNQRNIMMEDKSRKVSINTLKRPWHMKEDQISTPSTSKILYNNSIQKKTPSAQCIAPTEKLIVDNESQKVSRRKQSCPRKHKIYELYDENFDEQPGLSSYITRDADFCADGYEFIQPTTSNASNQTVEEKNLLTLEKINDNTLYFKELSLVNLENFSQRDTDVFANLPEDVKGFRLNFASLNIEYDSTNDINKFERKNHTRASECISFQPDSQRIICFGLNYFNFNPKTLCNFIVPKEILGIKQYNEHVTLKNNYIKDMGHGYFQVTMFYFNPRKRMTKQGLKISNEEFFRIPINSENPYFILTEHFIGFHNGQVLLFKMFKTAFLYHRLSIQLLNEENLKFLTGNL